ncbi:DNA mismatch repair protein Mlh3 isoform X2 [Nematostella vectensis]|uniref:DNA mismatch repair protein Mlh3 isoform X2 n=1 Tax=Nematostella vectensis TaxID=45351 RepID=UPI00207728B2|nr:DNA mismatch repair protein Mlh3 isoform X2 [Nematostella vectensis]
MMIRHLDTGIRSHLRSGVAISTLTQAIDELVTNALDAGASCINVHVDIPSFRVQVSDNGSGITKDNLEILGQRYCTSKCHSLSDLRKLSSYGFRGEALASIRDICGVLEIVTKHSSSYKTYCKLFRSGKPLTVTQSCFPRSNTGTTVTIHDIFSNLPVRRKLLSSVLDFERVRQRLLSIALIHPEVSFILFNDATFQKCLQTRKCLSVTSTFSQLFGNLKARSLKDVFSEHKHFKVSGHIGIEPHHNKNLQFVYINSRLLLKTKIHKLLNSMLSKSSFIKQLPSNMSENDVPMRSPPQRSSEKNAIFIINITCPLMVYDVILEPSKTLVEFQDWDGVLKSVQNCVEGFLMREGLVIASNSLYDGTNEESQSTQSDDSQNLVDLSSFEYQSGLAGPGYGKEIDTYNVGRSLHSSVVTRGPSVNLSDGDSSFNDSGGNGNKKGTELTENLTFDISDKANVATEASSVDGAQLSDAKKSPDMRTNQLDVYISSNESPNCFTSPNPIMLEPRMHRTQDKKSSRKTPTGPLRCTPKKRKSEHRTSLGDLAESKAFCTQLSGNFKSSAKSTEPSVPEDCNQLQRKGKNGKSESVLKKAAHDNSLQHPNESSQCPKNNVITNDNNCYAHKADSFDAFHEDRATMLNVDTSFSVSSQEFERIHKSSRPPQSCLTTNIIDKADKCQIAVNCSLAAKWECRYDPALGKKVYVNLKTGNTCFEDPEKGLLESEDGAQDLRTKAPLFGAPHLSFNCTPWLPREDRKQVSNQNDQGGDVSKMLTEWTNPVFGAPAGMGVSKLNWLVGGRNGVRAYCITHPHQLTKDMFCKMEVINQVDDKFIACLVHAEDSTFDESDISGSGELLVLIDQHAAHERIRLERLTQDLFATSPSDEVKPRVKSVPVSPPIEVDFTPEELRLIKSFRRELERTGLRFVIGSEPSAFRVIAHELPAVFVEREASELRHRRPSVAASIVKDLIQEQLQHLTSACGVTPGIPKTILRVLSSQACHGAIKFGEPLAVAECEQLIQDLASCNLPFQCAHGRPSTVPLIDLKRLPNKDDGQPNIKRIKLSAISSTYGKQ